MYFPTIQRSIVHPTIVMAKHVPFSLFPWLSRTTTISRTLKFKEKKYRNFKDVPGVVGP